MKKKKIIAYPLRQMVFVMNATYIASFLYISALMEVHLISSHKTLLNDLLNSLFLFLMMRKKVASRTNILSMHLHHMYPPTLLRIQNCNDIFYRVQHVCLHTTLLQSVHT
jgi:hypothetical protein